MLPTSAPARAAESVALGLQALHLLNRDGVPITAMSLEVWMLHASGALPQLSADIARRHARGEPLSPADVSDLFEKYCHKPDWRRSPGLQEGVTADLFEIGACVDDMVQIADTFGRTVAWAAQAIGPQGDPTAFRAMTQVLSDVASKTMNETARIRLSLGALRRRLEIK